MYKRGKKVKRPSDYYIVLISSRYWGLNLYNKSKVLAWNARRNGLEGEELVQNGAPMGPGEGDTAQVR